ncbi:facilitated trehalose transporter Tret1-like [Battus philenor]|uniref:facilitated trehalose transporter Tret1-like n=1 Tax=Battus philenor TaxID=42288 RepID=UPI0035CFF28F
MLWIFRSRLFRQYAIVLIVNLSILTTGMSLAWPSPMLVKLRNSTLTPLHRPVSEEEGSWIVSAGALGATCTLTLLGMLIDQIGRKYCVLLACIPKIIIGILFIFAKDIWVLIFGRAVIGVADYFLLTIIPAYAAEIADKEVRGALGTLLQILSSIGLAMTMSIGPFVSYRTFNVVFAAINLLVSVPVLFLPDSPYFLYSKGRINEAMDVLINLRGSEQLAKEELEMYAAAKNNGKDVRKMDLLKNRTVQKSLGLTIALCVISQFVGFNAVTYYLQTILESTKTNVMPEIASVVLSLVQVLAAMCSALINDRIKRRNILIYSLGGVFVGLVALGAFFKIKDTRQEVTGFLNYLPIISLIFVIFCYSAGIGSLFWVLVPELFDGPARALGLTVSLIVIGICIFLSTKFFTIITHAIGPAMTYWSFGVVCILGILFVFFCLPETNGKTFNEIQQSIKGNKENVEETKEKSSL